MTSYMQGKSRISVFPNASLRLGLSLPPADGYVLNPNGHTHGPNMPQSSFNVEYVFKSLNNPTMIREHPSIVFFIKESKFRSFFLCEADLVSMSANDVFQES